MGNSSRGLHSQVGADAKASLVGSGTRHESSTVLAYNCPSWG
jgi:hypothetical protein